MTFRRRQTFLSSIILLLCLLSWSPLSLAAADPSPAQQGIKGGVGLQVVPIASGEIVVIAVLSKSPATAAKLLPGDLIIAVDGKSLRGSNFADVTKNLLWGKAGTKVKLTWLRPGVAGKKSAQLLRTALLKDPEQDLTIEMLLPAATAPPEAAKP